MHSMASAAGDRLRFEEQRPELYEPQSPPNALLKRLSRAERRLRADHRSADWPLLGGAPVSRLR